MSLESIDFARADFGVSLPSDDCSWCNRSFGGVWYTADDARICARCAENARVAIHGGSPQVYWRSVAFGVMTAIMCAFAYYAFVHFAGGSWGVVACWGVGYFIGKMMKTGSQGIGGRRYQITASMLTYAAITVATGFVLFAAAHPPFWTYPLFLFLPVLFLISGKISLAALQLLFLFAGIRWAWTLTAGPKLQISGPFHSGSPAA